MTSGDERLRTRLLDLLHVYLERQRLPRLAMSAMLLLTGLAGFLVSWGMLRLGLDAMWLRYPLALLAGYVVFLGLLRGWALVEERSFAHQEALAAIEDDGVRRESLQSSRKDRDWGDWFDGWDWLPDSDEGVIFLVVLIALIAGGCMIVGVATVIAQAPLLMAEVLLDAVLVSALYQRLRKLEPQGWLTMALRRKAWPALASAVFLMAAGWLMHCAAPDARSIGGVWREVAPAWARR